MRGVPSVATNFPVVRLEGLFATGLILLSLERSNVVVVVHQVTLTLLDSRCYRCKTRASPEFVRCRRSRTLHFLAKIQAVTFIAGRLRDAVHQVGPRARRNNQPVQRVLRRWHERHRLPRAA